MGATIRNSDSDNDTEN